MLISPIDRNNESESEKQVSRINSPFWTLPTGVGGLGPPQSIRTSHSSEGIVLRARDTRLMERRKLAAVIVEPERRKMENRKHDSRWNPASHHILVIAIERKAGEPEQWKAGDRVSIVPKTRTGLARPQEDKHSPAETQKNRFPLLSTDDEDYVVHLSGKSPKDINENNG
ncbi:MAG: hypothetical protein HOK41_16780 [Nitrospina sp.]|jgi:hypothetical protein|nr:hypothetical protein [Nitrospina sp.]MBT6716999.1 hypothetical protein [Nitrospina sp.]